MTAALFREEALRSFEMSPWQPPLLTAPTSGTLLLVFVTLVVGAVLGFSALFEFARKEQVHGHLTPAAGWIRVSATSFGVVQQRLVMDGDTVAAGDVLLELAPGQGLKKGLTVPDKLIEEIVAQRATLESQGRLLVAQYENDLERIDREHQLATEDLASLELERELHGGRLRIAKRRLEDAQRLVAANVLAASDVSTLADGVRALALPLAENRRATARIQSSLAAAVGRRAHLALELQADQAAVRERLHSLAMEEHRLRGQSAARVLAPRAGVVASVRVGTGDRVTPGQRLLDILPRDTKLHARLFAPSAAMGVVEVGQPVRIYLDAFPYERHGAQVGRVVLVSASTLAPEETPTGAATFQIDVDFPEGFDLDPVHQAALRPGMTVAADLLGSRGTLLDWALEPLHAAAEQA